MAKISTVTSGMLQGVSQQPESVRLPSKLQESVNAYPDPVRGLIKRPPTIHLSDLDGVSTGLNAKIHTINRDADEQYIVVAYDEGIKVFELDGTEVHVEDQTGGFGYLDTTDAENDLKFLTVADYTFVANRAITPAAGSTTSGSRPSSDIAFVFIRNIRDHMSFNVAFTRSSTEYKFIVRVDTGIGTPNANEVDRIRAGNVAYKLKNLINAATGTTGVTATTLPTAAADIDGTVIKLTVATGTIDNLRVHDDTGDSDLYIVGIYDQVKRFDILPVQCQHDFRVKVNGDPTIDQDDYYLRFVADAGSGFGPGHWEESVGYGETLDFNDTTMPHQLVRRTDDGSGTVTGTPNAKYFDFDVVSWTNKAVGDTDTNPNPSFIGEPIRDVFFFRNRLGFLADDNVILSEAGNYFNFFRTTVIDLLDADPIDVGVVHSRVSILNHAIPFNEQLILFSDRTQFALDGQPVLTPRSVEINPVMEYENDVDLRPVETGRTIFMGSTQGNYLQVREIYALPDGINYDAPDISAEIPYYISAPCSQFAASTRSDVLAVVSETTQNVLWIYKYLWNGSEKVQSAWQKFEFDDGAIIKAVDFIDDLLYLIIERGSAVYLERIDLSPGLTDTGLDYYLCLDRRIVEASLAGALYDAASDTTSFTLPYALEAGQSWKVVNQSDGSEVEIVTSTSTTMTIKGFLASMDIFIGQPYSTTVTLSKPVIRSPSSSGGLAPNRTGRNVVQYATISFNDTNTFKVTVDDPYRATYTYEYNGPVAGDATLLLDTPGTYSDYIRVPIRSPAEHLTITLEDNQAVIPPAWNAVEWEIAYTPRASRVG